MLDEIKRKLEELYKTVPTSDISRLAFLKSLSEYILFTKSEPLLAKLFVFLREEEAHEAITDIRKSLQDPVYRELVQARDAIEDIPRFFPFSDYQYLEEAEEDFARWKSIKTEEELAVQKAEVKKETESGSFTETRSGSTLLLLIAPLYRKQLATVHRALIEKLDIAKERGFFSKYLDYDPLEGVLYLEGKEVRVNNRKALTNAHYLLAYLFTHDPFYQHFYDELEEEKALIQERPWKSYYDACVDIQHKVKATTGIKDFLDFSTGKGMYVRVSPRYSLNHIP